MSHRTFAPMWDLFRVSSDKLALCHLELMRKMNDLIRDINKYGDEQVKVHRKVTLLTISFYDHDPSIPHIIHYIIL